MNLTQEETQKLEKLCNFYQQAKALVIFAEELDPKSRAVLATIKELRDAFDHVMRVLSDIYLYSSAKKKKNPNYYLSSLEKAIGHLCRATFDALDITIIHIKSKITIHII